MKKLKYEDERTIYYIFVGSKYFPLDNFWEDNIKVVYDGLEYTNSEAAFQSAKLTDKSKRIPFTKMSAQQSKFIGKNPRLTKLRPDWNEIKDQVMYDIVRDKMMRNPWIKDLLLSTDSKIIEEGNYWNDTYWGVNIKTGKGKNQLGKTLMKLREEFRLENLVI